jgi:hypothetical protein
MLGLQFIECARNMQDMGRRCKEDSMSSECSEVEDGEYKQMAPECDEVEDGEYNQIAKDRMGVHSRWMH